MKRPVIKPEKEKIRENNVKAAVLGVPFDGTSITRTGSTMGPRKFRDVSSSLIPYHFDYDIDIAEVFNLHDCGDVNVKIGSAFETIERGKSNVLELLHGGAIPILV